MNRQHGTRLVGRVLLATALTMTVLAVACGSSTSANGVTDGSTTSPTTVATAGATESATAAAARPTTPPPPSDDEVLALGQRLWITDAGSVGCQFCHGPDARGGGVSGEGAPDIRMATKSMIRGALAGGVPLMGFIKLTEPELTAVSKYLDYLSSQP